MSAGNDARERAAADLARVLLLETREDINKVDQKAGLILATVGVVAGATAAAVSGGGVRPTGFAWPAQLLFWGGCLSLLVAVFLLGAAVFPRLGPPVAGRMNYFGDIQDSPGTADQILRTLRGTNAATRDIEQFLYLGRSTQRKYVQVRWGMMAGGLSFLLTAAGYALGVMLTT